MALEEDIEALERSAAGAFDAADDACALERARADWIGRSGRLKDLMGRIKEAAPDRKKAVGARLNAVKTLLEARHEARRAALACRRPAGPLPDPTLPGASQPRGARHPLTTTLDRFVSIFERLGFTIADGPEIEDDFHNFDALNIPPDHPVREMADTFVLDDGAVLRSQTSTIQIRAMEAHVASHGGGTDMPPLRVVAPGRTYRPDAVDATHHYGFSQIEGLAVGRGVAFADLQGTLGLFAREMYGEGTKTRFRPSFFPFTEPSAELDISCIFCGGKGCRICKHAGWVELGGCGMVDPNVFEAVGIDPESHSGFAFGFGIERMAMFLLGIDDLRRFTENDLRFLRQF